MRRAYKEVGGRKFTAILALSFFIYGVLLITIFYLFSTWLIDKKEAEQFSFAVKHEAMAKEKFLALYMDNLSSSLKAIAYNPYFLSYIKDTQYADSAKFLFLTIMLEHGDYMQLRYIDRRGMERIRFDRQRPDARPYPVEKLQNKSDRYYFRESIRLKEGKVYTSRIDYNMEHGRIVKPIVPVFRVSMPIYFEGSLRGVLTINTFAKRVIDLFVNSSAYNTVIFDKDGYLIYYQNRFYDRNYDKMRLDDILPVKLSDIPNGDTEFISQSKRIYIRSIKMGSRDIYIALTGRGESEIALRKEDYKAAIALLFILMLLAVPISYILSRPTEYMFDTVVKQREKLEELNRTLEERVKSKTEENAKKDRLIIHQSRLAELGEMIGNIAHQWRHPLTRLSLILQNIKAMQKRGRLEPEKLESMLTSANSQINFMSETIENFRHFYRPLKDDTPFTVKSAFESAMQIIEYDLKHRNIDISYYEESEITLYGKQNQFSQVLLSLIANARDAIGESNPQSPKIEIRCRTTQSKAIIEIVDNGSGIPDENLDKIFEPYFSTKKGKGTGIGLYMVKTIIEERFRGNITVENSGKGAKFTISVALFCS